jgi:hypothetical protein
VISEVLDSAKTAAVWGAHGGYLVQGLDADPQSVEPARAHVKSLNLYGMIGPFFIHTRFHKRTFILEPVRL